MSKDQFKTATMQLIKETDAKNNTIYASNAKGMMDKGNFINVDRSTISSRETISDVQGRRSDGSIETSTVDIYTSIGDKASTAFFEFAANNTDVEWSQTKTTQNGIDVNYIATSHNGNGDVGQALVINRIFSQNDANSIQSQIMGSPNNLINIREANHSHPLGSNAVSQGDVNAAGTLQQRFPNALMQNYTKGFGYTYFDQYSIPGLLPEFEITAPRKKR